MFVFGRVSSRAVEPKLWGKLFHQNTAWNSVILTKFGKIKGHYQIGIGYLALALALESLLQSSASQAGCQDWQLSAADPLLCSVRPRTEFMASQAAKPCQSFQAVTNRLESPRALSFPVLNSRGAGAMN